MSAKPPFELSDFSMVEKTESFFRYLVVKPERDPWNFAITDIAYTHVPGGVPYPPYEHPENYSLNQKTGRILLNYQIIHISKGSGDFWSEDSGEARIGAGDVFILHPGIRHRDRPGPESGWNEHWVGICGAYAEK